MQKQRTYISFDWALKKLLRQKANYSILEGFLSELLKEDLKIKNISDPESNKTDRQLKINRVDILVEDTNKQLLAIELQYNREIDYFYRMLFTTSKASVEYINEGYNYSQIRKVYSINLLYFELGQGKDYVYHGKNDFIGIHLGDKLQLSQAQKEKFLYDEVYKIYPEYYVIKINSFNDIAKDSLDEWIYFFKHSQVPDNFNAKGLKEVREKMRIEQMDEKEKKAYERHQLNLVSERNIIETARIEGRQEGRQEGKEEGRQEQIALQSLKNLLKTIAKFPNWNAEELADFTEINTDLIEGLLSTLKTGDLASAQIFVAQHFLQGITLDQSTQDGLDILIEKAASILCN